MNFHYSTYIYNTTYRPQNSYSNFNEDAHCDNEVNLILEKNYNQYLIEQSTEKLSCKQQESISVNQIDQYYFIPIRDQNSTTRNTVTDSSSLFLSSDFQYPSIFNLFDDISLNMNSSDTTTVNKSNNYNLTDADLTALFISSIIPTNSSPSPTTSNEHLIDNRNNTLDDVFDFVSIDKKQTIAPPPGFENFLFDSSSNTTNNNRSISSMSNADIQTPVSSSDTINFSQLLQSTSVDPQQQQPIGGNVRSSSSSHSSFTSDEQSIFFPMSTHPYSSSSSMLHATSQIYSTNTPSSSTTTTITNSAAKPHIPKSLSLNNNNNNNHFLSSSTTNSPVLPINDGGISSNHSFFTNGHTDFSSLKSTTNKYSSNPVRTSSSSASSSTSSSIDDALIQLTQQQQHGQNLNKLFNDEPTSIFHFSSLPNKPNINKQEQAVQDNINFLASMATTSESNWTQQQMHPMITQQNKTNSINTQELIQNLNELCYKGFDELNSLIQEQRWVQNYVNINSSPNSPPVNLNGSNCCSSRILIVPEYFIFKCKKVEITASHVFELLAIGKPELRLRDLMFVFKSWKESILNAELIHQEEENKLKLTTEHPQSYYMTDDIIQSLFDHVSNSIRQLCNLTQQARAAFQYATLNVFQMSSRQQQVQSQLSNSNSLAQFQTMQQQKSSSSSSSVYRPNGSIRTTP